MSHPTPPEQPQPNISSLFPPVIMSPYPPPQHSSYHQPPLPASTQRCLSVCSNSSTRKMWGMEPVCRGICWKVDRSIKLRDEGERVNRFRRERRRVGREREGGAVGEEQEGQEGLFNFRPLRSVTDATSTHELRDSVLNSTSSTSSSNPSPSSSASNPTPNPDPSPSPSLIDQFSHSFRLFIAQRSITTFKCSLSEMQEIQDEATAEEFAADTAEVGSMMLSQSQSQGRGAGAGQEVDGDVLLRAQRRWEAVNDLQSGFGPEPETEGQVAQQLADQGEFVTAQPTTLAERQLLKHISSVNYQYAHLLKLKKDQQTPHNPAIFSYLTEILPSGGHSTIIPLHTILLTPLYKIQHRFQLLFTPPKNLFNLYVSSFQEDADGSGKSKQRKSFEKMVEHVGSGKVGEFGWKVGERCVGLWGRWVGLKGGEEEEEGRGTRSERDKD